MPGGRADSDVTTRSKSLKSYSGGGRIGNSSPASVAASRSKPVPASCRALSMSLTIRSSDPKLLLHRGLGETCDYSPDDVAITECGISPSSVQSHRGYSGLRANCVQNCSSKTGTPNTVWAYYRSIVQNACAASSPQSESVLGSFGKSPERSAQKVGKGSQRAEKNGSSGRTRIKVKT
jgi:hypothetical protein